MRLTVAERMVGHQVFMPFYRKYAFSYGKVYFR